MVTETETVSHTSQYLTVKGWVQRNPVSKSPTIVKLNCFGFVHSSLLQVPVNLLVIIYLQMKAVDAEGCNIYVRGIVLSLL